MRGGHDGVHQPYGHERARPAASRQWGRGAAALFWLTSVQAALVFAQAALAGQFLNGNQGALNLHAANAEVIPLVTIAQLVVAIRVWRRRKVAWPTAAAASLLSRSCSRSASGTAASSPIYAR